MATWQIVCKGREESWALQSLGGEFVPLLSKATQVPPDSRTRKLRTICQPLLPFSLCILISLPQKVHKAASFYPTNLFCILKRTKSKSLHFKFLQPVAACGLRNAKETLLSSCRYIVALLWLLIRLSNHGILKAERVSAIMWSSSQQFISKTQLDPNFCLKFQPWRL